MGWSLKKVKATCRPSRGGALDAAAIEDAITNSWAQLQESLEEVDDAEKKAIKAHFNSLNVDANLGDRLFGDCDDFVATLATVTKSCKKAFFDELFSMEVIDEQSIEDSLTK